MQFNHFCPLDKSNILNNATSLLYILKIKTPCSGGTHKPSVHKTPPFLDVVVGGRSHLASVSNRLPHCCCLSHPSYCLHRRNPHALPLSPATAALSLIVVVVYICV